MVPSYSSITLPREAGPHKRQSEDWQYSVFRNYWDSICQPSDNAKLERLLNGTSVGFTPSCGHGMPLSVRPGSGTTAVDSPSQPGVRPWSGSSGSSTQSSIAWNTRTEGSEFERMASGYEKGFEHYPVDYLPLSPLVKPARRPLHQRPNIRVPQPLHTDILRKAVEVLETAVQLIALDIRDEEDPVVTETRRGDQYVVGFGRPRPVPERVRGELPQCSFRPFSPTSKVASFPPPSVIRRSVPLPGEFADSDDWSQRIMSSPDGWSDVSGVTYIDYPVEGGKQWAGLSPLVFEGSDRLLCLPDLDS